MPFTTIPSKARLHPQPFTAHASSHDLADLKTLLKLSKLGPQTYENLHTDGKSKTSYGVSHEWMATAKQHWETQYDWRETERRISGFPNFTVSLEESGVEFQLHFVALFSKNPDAIPMVLMHGWPGSFLEFMDVLDLFRSKYTPETLPYHLIVPSLPGWAYSSGPPLDQDFTTEDAAKVIDNLMVGLGFDDGYIAQGGDIGSFIARILGATSSACKAVHLNMCIGITDTTDALSEEEERGMQQAADFYASGRGYSIEQGTKPATIGFVLSSSPLALLAWIGEKFLSLTHTTPPLNSILDSLTLYWLTNTYPRAIYTYRQLSGSSTIPPTLFHPEPKYHIAKPLGYSRYPYEIIPFPARWVAKTGNLAWHREHSEGGHFAAMEQPVLFAQDLEDFAKAVWS